LGFIGHFFQSTKTGDWGLLGIFSNQQKLVIGVYWANTTQSHGLPRLSVRLSLLGKRREHRRDLIPRHPAGDLEVEHVQISAVNPLLQVDVVQGPLAVGVQGVSEVAVTGGDGHGEC